MLTMDYYTIIGRDPGIFRGHVKNTLHNAGLDRDLWTFNVIVYHNDRIAQDTTDEIISICDENDINYHLHFEDPSKSFIQRLYDCWNLGYKLGKHPLVFRGGSDQTWYPGSFAAILNTYNDLPGDAILQAQTIESMLSHPASRHFCRDFGLTYETYKEAEFLKFCEEIKHEGPLSIAECLQKWGKPTRMINGPPRTDGCSWLQTRKNFERFGPMPTIRGGITGDVLIHDMYQRAGIPNYMVGDCITYHFVQGERRSEVK